MGEKIEYRDKGKSTQEKPNAGKGKWTHIIHSDTLSNKGQSPDDSGKE